MKKLLSILGAVTLMGTTSISVIACTNEPKDEENVKPPVQKNPKVNWTKEDFLEKLGDFTYEVDSTNEEKITLKSKDEKTPLFLEGDGETFKYEYKIDINEKMHILPKDIMPTPDFKQPFGREIFTAVSFNKEFFDEVADQYNSSGRFTAIDNFLRDEFTWGNIAKEKFDVLKETLDQFGAFAFDELNETKAFVDKIQIVDDQGNKKDLFYFYLSLPFQTYEFNNNLLNYLNDFFIKNNIENHFLTEINDTYKGFYYKTENSFNWFEINEGTKNIDILIEFISEKFNSLNNQILDENEIENFDKEYLFNIKEIYTKNFDINNSVVPYFSITFEFYNSKTWTISKLEFKILLENEE